MIESFLNYQNGTDFISVFKARQFHQTGQVHSKAIHKINSEYVHVHVPKRISQDQQ